MTRKKKLKRILYSILITILVFVLILSTIILYPQPLFANKMEYRQFNVYSNEKFGDEIKPILDSVLLLVEKSELYDSTYKADIFFACNTFFNDADDKVFGQGPTARSIDNNLIIKVEVDLKKNRAYTTFPKQCQQALSYPIAHEFVHCLQTHKYGMLKFNPIHHPELWKLEGYPEFIARQKFSNPPDSLKKEIKRFVKAKQEQGNGWIITNEDCAIPEYYPKGMLMTEYLMNVCHLTYDQILVDKRSEEEIYSAMITWAK